MTESFDPYRKWLGILPKDQPPNHYRLLAIELFESDADVIEGAADRQMSHLRTFQTGTHSALSQKLLNECAAARLTLLNPQKKVEYDRQLREKMQAADSGVQPLAPAAGRDSGAFPQPPGPQARAPGQGEGAQRRAQPISPVAAPVPRAMPMPQARAMPVVEAMPVVQATPVITSDGGSSSVHKRFARRKPLWQQPLAIIGGVAAAALIAVAGYYLSSGKSTSPPVAATNTPKPKASNTAATPAKPLAKIVAESPRTTPGPSPSIANSPAPAEPAVVSPSAPTAPDFEIIEATWGAGDQWVNVTDGVRKQVKDNRLMMIVWSNLFGSPEDPAPGIGKKLRIQYRARGKRRTVDIPDLYFVYLDGNPPAPPTDSPDKLELLEARYGAGGSFVDVLPQLRMQLRDGRLWAPADEFAGATADELAKSGIGPNIFKVLWVRYRNATGEHFTYAWNADPLVIESRVPEAAGPPVDLLKLIDLKRDVVEGNWTMSDGVLHAPAARNGRLELPFDPPDEYALTVVAEGDPEIKDISVMLPVDGRPVLSVLDGFSGIGSGLQFVNGRFVQDNPTYAWRRSRMFEQGRPNTLVYVVRRRSVRVLRDGAEIIRWSGDPRTFSIDSHWAMRNSRRIGLKTFDTAFRVSKLELVLLAAEKSPMLAQLEPGKTVDVLKHIDLHRDLGRGKWEYDGQSLVSPSSAHGRLQLPATLPADYRLDVVAQRESGNDSLLFRLPLAGITVGLPMDSFGGKLTGLELIDGKRVDANETKYEGSIFADGKPHAIAIAVRNNQVRLLCDEKLLVDWTGDSSRLTHDDQVPYADRIYLEDWYSRYRLTKIELTALPSEPAPASPTQLAGEPIDLLKQIDVKRDSENGDWQLNDGVLVSPDQRFSKLLLPPPPAEEYQLAMVFERSKGRFGIAPVLVVGGRQVAAAIDGYNGNFAGLEAVDGKDCHDNVTSRRGRLLSDGKQYHAVYTVRRNSVQVVLDGQTVINWKGDPSSLSLLPGWKVRDTTKLALSEFETVCRISKLQVTPLRSQGDSRAMVASANAAFETGKAIDVLKQIDLKRDVQWGTWHLRNATLIAEAVPNARLQVPIVPPEEYKITMVAKGDPITRDIVFGLPIGDHQALLVLDGWSGTPSALQLIDGKPGTNNETTVNRRVLADGESEIVCRVRKRSIDVTCNGDSVIHWSGDPARLRSDRDVRDPKHIYLFARSTPIHVSKFEIEPLESTPSQPIAEPPRKLADLATDGQSRTPVPDDDALKKAKQEVQKKYASRFTAAKSLEQKRGLAQELAQKAAADGKSDAKAYVMLNQAVDLAETAGDIALTWQMIDQLAKTFAVDGLARRQQSLVAMGKAASKSPEQNWELADAACRLIVLALAAGDAGTLKKATTQAQSFAKRTKNREVQKTVTGRANDAGKLAAELEAVAAARETLKTKPNDPQANLSVGHYELCAAGNFEAALPKLAKSGDEAWKKLAADESALDNRQSIGPRIIVNGRPIRRSQPADAPRELAAADAWWSRAEDEPWPGKHYLRMRAARWYGSAVKSLVDADRRRAVERLRSMLAEDDGLPNWELFKRSFSQSNEPAGDVVRIDSRSGGLQTAVEYDGSIDVTMVVRTTANMVRLSSHNWGWGWNYSIAPNRWHTLRFLVTPLANTVFADGVSVYTDAATTRTPRKLNSAPVSINASGDDVIEIKKFVVRAID